MPRMSVVLRPEGFGSLRNRTENSEVVGWYPYQPRAPTRRNDDEGDLAAWAMGSGSPE